MSDLKDVKFVNLDTKSTYSSPYGVSHVDDHVAQTIRVGHSGCCVADINSGASFYDLFMARDSPGKKTSKALKECEKEKQDTTFAATLAYFDDVTYTMNDVGEIKKLIDSKDRRFSYKVNKTKDLDKEEDLKEVFERSMSSNRYRSDSLIIIPINKEGFKHYNNLITETSLPKNLYSDGSKRIPLSRILELSEGLMVVVGGNRCAVKRMLEDDNKEGADKFLKKLESVLGNRLVYSVTIQQNQYVYDNDSERYISRGEARDLQKETNEYLINRARELKRDESVIVRQDAHMPTKEHKVAQDVLIDTNKSPIPRFQEPLYLMSVEEMWEKASKLYDFSKEDFVKWCENSFQIASQGFGVAPNLDFKLPDTPIKAHFSNTPYEFLPEFKKKLGEMGLLKEKSDYLYFRIQALLKLEGESFDQEIKDLNLKDYIDKEQTEINKKKLQKCTSDIENLRENTKDDPFSRLVFRHAYKNENIMTMIRSSVIKDKVNFLEQDRQREFFNELKVMCCNGIIELSPYFLSFELSSDLGTDIEKTSGLGRGSGVGSIVNYAMDITDAVPWEWDLLFERFLVPERIGLLYPCFKEHDTAKFEGLTHEDIDNLDILLEKLKGADKKVKDKDRYKEELYFVECNPWIATYFLSLLNDGFKSDKNEQNSILAFLLGLGPEPLDAVDRSTRSLPDIDFDSNYKDEICSFFQKLYGKDYTCYIGTYSGLQVKSTIQALLRGVVAPDMVIKASKEFDKYQPLKNDDHEVIEKPLEYFLRVSRESPVINKILKSRESLRDAAEYCLGNYLHMSVHAGGFINSPVKVVDHVPCNWDKEKKAYVSQLAKDEVEGVGFIKNDYLGLSTLTVIEHACEIINRDKKEDEKISLKTIIRTNCKDSLDKFSRETLGIFQFSGEAVTQGVTRTNDMRLHYIPFLTSVYRPGPMGAGFHNKAIDLINGTKEEELFDESLREILSPTKSLIAYQEQVMAITKKIGGFDGFEADKVRRAMGKKKLDVIKDFEERFVQNAIDKFSYSESKARELWGMLCNFAEYGFNKSHAVAYGLTSYACMYLNYHYPLAFKAASLNDACTNNSKKDIYKRYQLSWGEDIIKPDINLSGDKYDVKKGKIVMPLFSIKNVGEASAKKISDIAPFKSLQDLCYRGRFHSALSAREMKPLAIVGALDSLKPKIEDDSDLSKEDVVLLSEMMGIDIPKKVKDKISLGVSLSDQEEKSLRGSLGGVGFIPTFKFRRYIIRNTPSLLGLSFSKAKSKGLIKPSLEELTPIAKKEKEDIEKNTKFKAEAEQIDLKKEQYKLLDIQNFDIKGTNKDILGAIDNVIMADEVFGIEKRCQEFISNFDTMMTDTAKNGESMLPAMLSFYDGFSLLSPHYKIGEYIAKRYADNLSSIHQSRGMEPLIFESMVNNRYFWKKEYAIDITESLVGKISKFSSFYYRISESESSIETNLSHMSLACFYTFLIKNKKAALAWAEKVKSNTVNEAIERIKGLQKEDIEDFKELTFLLSSKFKANTSESKLTDQKDFSPQGIDERGIKLPLSHEEVALFNAPRVKVCGSVFKLPKKMREGVREFKDKKTGNMKTMFKFNISNVGKQVLCLTFDTNETELKKVSMKSAKDGRSIVSREGIDAALHSNLNDYDSVICEGSMSYSLNFDSRIQIILAEVLKL